MPDSDPDWDEYDSGPFCVHWETPWDCNEVCACGHECRRHDRHATNDDETPGCLDCDCERFKPKEKGA